MFEKVVDERLRDANVWILEDISGGSINIWSYNEKHTFLSKNHFMVPNKTENKPKKEGG